MPEAPTKLVGSKLCSDSKLELIHQKKLRIWIRLWNLPTLQRQIVYIKRRWKNSYIFSDHCVSSDFGEFVKKIEDCKSLRLKKKNMYWDIRYPVPVIIKDEVDQLEESF